MLVAAAVCPCPPLLVPEVAAGAAFELDEVRAACAQALDALDAARPDRLVVVGPMSGDGSEVYPQGTPGSFRDFGVPLDVHLGLPGPAAPGDPADARPLPPSLAVAGWLLAHTSRPTVPVSGLGVGVGLDVAQCVAAGAALAAGEERLALLAMGDGSARRSLKAPGYFDERAAGFDAVVARALATADPAALEAVDPQEAADLMAAGRAPWQVLAGAAQGAGLRGRLLYDDAPYGVGYLVAAWT